MDKKKGVAGVPGHCSVDETVDRLKGMLESKGISLFALAHLSGEVAKDIMKMPPAELLIFGNPRAGTTLMLASPDNAIDLPLKILAWEDLQGKVWLS